MKGRILTYFVLASVVTIFVSSQALAECPKGQQEVQITTPSGKTKALCIPDAGVQGIENAADHSGGTIVTAQCPVDCWTQDQINALNTTPYELTCKQSGYNTYSGLVDCVVHKDGVYAYTAFALLSRDPKAGQYECKNYAFQTDKFDMNFEQYDACYALLAPFILNP